MMKKLFLLLLLLFSISTIHAQSTDLVTLEKSTVTWQTYAYELAEDNSVIPGSFDPDTIVERTFETWILENEYLRLTLLPDFGGRILSMIYKPTGHEELYQNPVGAPYLIGDGVFYYDWLMVYGGMFPTFPEPEHGKTWLLPWDFEVISDTDDAVTVKMSMVDDIDFAGAPGQYNVGQTNIEVDFYITLHAGRTAVDTRVELRNPNSKAVQFEYWMNIAMAPGSEPGSPSTDDAAEIIAPIDQISIPAYWTAIAAQETRTGPGIYYFDTLRNFVDWPDSGIAYAYPGMQDSNFWGVINHNNEEGIFRVADNTITPGLKIWTFGYPTSIDVDPFADGRNWYRPFVELWAGVTTEFWKRTYFRGETTIIIEEAYSPSVGLSNVTHASSDLLVNAISADESSVTIQLFGMNPGSELTVNILSGDEIVQSRTITADVMGNTVRMLLRGTTADSFTVEDASGTLLLSGDFAS